MASEKKDKHDDECCGGDGCRENHEHSNVGGNPFANLDEETQRQIQELQMLEQGFQQLLMQKNTYTMEKMNVFHRLTQHGPVPGIFQENRITSFCPRTETDQRQI